MITAVIVDDDIKFLKILKETIKHTALLNGLNMEVITMSDPYQCLALSKVFDIYFLDILMPQLSGVELAKKLREKYIDKEFIFISAYEQYMRTSIFVKPRAFIRKEHLQEDLYETFQILKNIFIKKNEEIIVKDNKKDCRIKPGNIIYARNAGHYVTFYYTEENKVVIRNRLKELEVQLKGFDFLQVHQSYMVNLNYVESYRHCVILMKNKDKIPVSGSYKDIVEMIMLNRMIGDRN